MKSKFSETQHWWQVGRRPVAATIAFLQNLRWDSVSPLAYLRVGAKVIRAADVDVPFHRWPLLLATCSGLSWQQASVRNVGEG